MLARTWNDGDDRMARDGHGDTLRNILAALASGSTLAELKAMRADELFDGQLARIGGVLWTYDEDSTLSGDDVLVATPDHTPTAGRWLVMPGQVIDLALPFTYATADAAAIYTVPTGAAIKLLDAWWEVTTNFTGGSSSAIGLSSNNTDLNTQGDILGGAGGDVAAGLVVGEFQGTTGAIDLATNPIAGLIAANTVRFDRIVSAFTAGVGVAHVLVHVTKNAGA